MNACQQVFPYVIQLLCRWHIFECIVKHCKPSYQFDREWHDFEFLWTTLIKSSDEPTYETNYDKLFRSMISKHASNVLTHRIFALYCLLYRFVNFFVFFHILKAWFYLRDNWLADLRRLFLQGLKRPLTLINT